MRPFDSVKRPADCLLWLTAALALAGCTTTRYVTVPCLTEGQLPTEAQCQDAAERAKLTDKQRSYCEPERVGGRLTGQAQRDFQIAAGAAVRLRAWGQAWRDIAQDCTGEARP